MTKNVLDIGNCGPDHGSIKSMIESRFDAKVTQANTMKEALPLAPAADLILVNRVFDWDSDDGLKAIKTLKESEDSSQTPIMLITNYEQYQTEAAKLGAVAGFGKANLAEAAELLAEYLDPAS